MFKLGNGILFCGDAYKVLKEIEQVDLILTDPPYLINYAPNWRVKDFQGFKDYLPDLEELAFLFHQVLKNNRHAYVFTHYKTYHLFFEAFSKFFRIKNALVWVKNHWTAGDLKGQYAPSYELILYMHKGRRALRGKRERDVLFFKRVPPPRLHPAQKPIDLLKFLIEKSSSPQEVVLDPFAGSGSTLIAAEKAGRRWIGVEKESYFCEIILNRFKKMKATHSFTRLRNK